MNTLHLTLKKVWFDLMVSGEKRFEYRKPSDWITIRLAKDCDVIKFVNGYGNDKPYFVCEYNGYEVSEKDDVVSYDDSTIEVEQGDYIIHLGKILETGNLR